MKPGIRYGVPLIAPSLVVLLGGLMAGAAQAELTPSSAGFDPHVQFVVYNPLNVVRVTATLTNSTQIIFADTEQITHIAIGDADAWLPNPSGNLLFIKPLQRRIATNMQVVTRRPDGTSRSYQFYLIAAQRSMLHSSPAIYAVRFRYPDDERDSRNAKATLVAQQTAIASLSDSWAHGPRNWRYVAQGSRLIEPAEVSDNGRQTAFRFPGNMRLPTIYTAAPDGTETIVSYTMVGDQSIVQTTARTFMLRDGKEVLRIVNRGYDPVGISPATGTGLPDVLRTLRRPP